MKKFLLFCVLIAASYGSFAAHIIGGELRYEFVGPGSLPNTKIYRLILLLVKGDATGPNVASLAPSYLVGIFNNDNNTKLEGPEVNSLWRLVQNNPPGILNMPITASPCLTNQPTLQYTYATYTLDVELPDNNNGYTVAHQTCCRQASMANVDQTGATYTCIIPGSVQLQSLFEIDNGPQYHLPVSVICFDSPFTLDFSATDADGDSLVYGFCNAYDGGFAVDASYSDAFPPPYNSVTYTNGFSASSPLGSQATINPQTGIISGIAPNNPGNYVVCVCVQAYRNGRLLTTHRKDLLVRVSPCTPTVANPDPGFTTCDGFNIQFNHNSSGATSVFWDFGDPSTDADTSITDNPSYVYPDTGIYYVKFIINKGGNCTDSQIIKMGIYPGFFPGFQANAPFCAGQPVQFTDTTHTAYGVVDSWSWNFGNTTTLADTSHLQLPQYTYPAAGTYHASFIVTNSKGCIDTVYKDIVINPLPTVTVPPDTIYCGRDSLQLSATGTAGGTYTWLPATNIIGAATATPTVFPSMETIYAATINVLGCKKTDSIRVTPSLNISNDIVANPAGICQEDTLTLTGSANRTSHLRWQWTPAASVLSPLAPITKAFPNVTTTYTLQTKWGEHCITSKTINIPVTPLANPDAGDDTYICAGQTTTMLSASGGNTYHWTPVAGLSDPNIANPVASPAVTTNYIVHVGVTGCSRLRTDTVNVLVRPKPALTVTNDTLICIVDGLQLNASGSGTALWSPNYNINNVNILNPFATPAVATTYHVQLTDVFGCRNFDSVIVNVKPKTVVNAGLDTAICKTEGFTLGATGDALHYTWTPATYLSNPNVLNPFVRPLETITYQVIGNIGTCSDTSDITIKVAPYPPANAGPDSIVCIGFNAQLFASGGSSYSWTPSTFLSSSSSQNPLVTQPTSTTTYIVSVTDTLGCTKAITDTVKVTVIPHLNVGAGSDTTLVEDQPISLHGSGALNYTWTWLPVSLPGWLSSTNVANPVATPKDNITYILQGTDQYGCRGTDSINILVYTVDPSFYVPTAFTPNGDNLNDVIKPILLGMRAINYFRVYNRFGELVYETKEKDKGWNGIYKGRPQDSGTYVWMAQGVTYKNQVITRKGFVVLIR